MNAYLKLAQEYAGEMTAHRRFLHTHAEVGCDLPVTGGYIIQQLTALGYHPKRIAPGCVSASIGRAQGKTILLRADCDALPMQEESGLPYQSENPGAAHTCGHDMHAAMLLGAAALLKAHEGELNGEVRLLFQSDEEGLTGALSAIHAGILDGVDAAMSQHVYSGEEMKVGTFYVTYGAAMASQDRFRIEISGHGGHGAMPDKTIDPINVGTYIQLGLQTIVAREMDQFQPLVITVGRFTAGNAANVIPQNAVLEGTIRTFSDAVRERAKARLTQIGTGMAQVYGAECNVTFPAQAPANINNDKMVTDMSSYIMEMGCSVEKMAPAMGSEDFAFIAAQVPSVFFAVGAGGDAPAYRLATNHHPKVQFNEDCMPYGAAALAWCAVNWLRDNSK
ncbi:MAG: M20 family metallopeptidase [Oscillospiraceae bacterium]|nr:M20 family metallopeptidase [Oscillospiraceae bacterium]